MIDRYDVLAMIGLGLLGAGLWLVSESLALIGVGFVLLMVGIAGAIARARGD